MVQLASAGSVDFSRADILDARWWWKVRTLAEHHASRNRLMLYRQDFLHDLAVLDYKSPEQFQHHWDHACELRRSIVRELMPWEAPDESVAAEVNAALSRQYKEEFGDQDDPAYAAEIDRLIQHWESEAPE